MKAYLTIELEIIDFEKIYTDAKKWETQNNFEYYSELESLIVDYILANDINDYNLVNSDLHIVTAKEIE